MSKENTDIDFQVINTLDPRVMPIADTSEWGQIEGKASIIEVILPGEESPIINYFDKSKINIMNSSNLKLICTVDCAEVELINLPDGIYEITVKGSPDTFFKTRKYLRTTLTQLELDKIFIQLNLTCKEKDTNILDTLYNIESLRNLDITLR